MVTEKVYLPVKKIILDIILIQCVGWPILFLFLWGTPFRRGFFCDDEELKHPYHESTVPSWSLYITGLGLNVVVMLIIEWLNPPNENKEIIVKDVKVPNWMYHAYCAIGIFAFGACCSQLTTDVMKYTIGRFRPHFLYVCEPDVCKTATAATDMIYHLNFTCTNPEFINNKRIMKEMRLSFPSGHSSFSMYCMTYFAIYLHKRMTWDGSKLLRHTLQFLSVLYAIFTAMTRISDYKHHWSDVLTGSILGATTSCITAFGFARFDAISNENGGAYIEVRE